MIKRIHHIGIAVQDLEEPRNFFENILGLKPDECENFGELQFSFIPAGGTALELLRSTTPEGLIQKFVAKKGQGLHHLAMQVDDIQAELDRLKENGVALINDRPYRNAHRELVAFLHPKSTFGILIELVQAESK
ncbi:MAG: methylmalonyl-CoA epimerase [Syntrophobacteraceae bacterium]